MTATERIRQTPAIRGVDLTTYVHERQVRRGKRQLAQLKAGQFVVVRLLNPKFNPLHDSPERYASDYAVLLATAFRQVNPPMDDDLLSYFKGLGSVIRQEDTQYATIKIHPSTPEGKVSKRRPSPVLHLTSEAMICAPPVRRGVMAPLANETVEQGFFPTVRLDIPPKVTSGWPTAALPNLRKL